MNNSLEALLAGLIPYLTGPIPPALNNYATSLLAQSRSRISNLRPEEESARAYLCAHIACERLRTRLDLPQVQPRPPLPKKQYAVLYKQFNEMLTGSGKQSAAEPPTVEKTPTNSPKKGTSRAAGKVGSLSGNTPVLAQKTDEPWLPMIHYICSTTNEGLNATNAIPYMLSGVRVVMPSQTLSKLSGEQMKKTQAAIAALYILTTSKLSGKEITGKEYTRTRGLLMEAFDRYNNNSASGTHNTFNTPGTSTRGKRASGVTVGKIATTDVDNALNEIMDSSAAVDWLGTIPVGIGVNNVPVPPPQQPAPQSSDDEFDEAVKLDRLEREQVERMERMARKRRAAEDRQTGIGRMMQDRVDYTSEKKRKGYLEWKEKVLQKVNDIERLSAVGVH